MARLHQFWTSGNSYKVRLLLSELGRPYEGVAMDRYALAQKEPAFLAVNPRGQVPAWEERPGRVLTESAAILFYLSQGTPFMPPDPWAQAHVLSWLFYEQGHLCNQGAGMVHYWVTVVNQAGTKRAEFAAACDKARAEFGFLDRHLQGRDWLVGDGMTIADIACYVYPHRVPAVGAFALDPWPNVKAWMQRIAARPRHVRFEEQPT